jgi:hypothetical protein
MQETVPLSALINYVRMLFPVGGSVVAKGTLAAAVMFRMFSVPVI